MHFDAFGLAGLIFVTLGFIGSGIADGLGHGYAPTRRWLLAPFAGLCLIALPAAVLSKIGFPAHNFAWPLVGTLIAANAIYWLVRYPTIDRQRAALWAGGFFVAMLFVGWPLLIGGYDWVGYGNEDMTVYVMGGNHFYAHGYYQFPPLSELLSRSDRSWDTSISYSLAEVRFASEMLIAVLMAATSLTATQVYMPLMIAIHVVVLSSTAALLCSERGRERIAFVALFVVGASANLALGTLNQLMPQDLGLAALACSATVALDRPAAGSNTILQAILGGLFVATLLIGYPEILPFLVLPLIVFAVIAFWKREMHRKNWLLFISLGAVSTLFCANDSIVGALHLLIFAASAQKGVLINYLFPYFLTPYGLAQGWGFVPTGGAESTWQLQVWIIAGGLLYVAAIVSFLRDAWRLEPISIVAVTMLLFFLELFITQSGFGLYKLAMFGSPFVLGALTLAVFRTFDRSVTTPEACSAE